MAKTLSIQMCDALIGVGAFASCDRRCFIGQGRIKTLTFVQKEDDLIILFSRFGLSTAVSSNDCLMLESFVCKLHGKTSCKSVNKVRYDNGIYKSPAFKRKKGTIPCNGASDLHVCQTSPCGQVLSLHI